MREPRLHQLFEASARAGSRTPAVIEPGLPPLSYGQLDRYADAIAGALKTAGVVAGDRVGLCAPKSGPVLAAVFGALKAGAAYVPTDPMAPPDRNAYIFSDCAVRAVVATRSLADALESALGKDAYAKRPLDTGDDLKHDFALLVRNTPPPVGTTANIDLAYILYTSGSTGRPKGVMHSHRSALAFIDWCTSELRPVADDRFSSHAPLHFDLSILDIYLAMKHGASIVLIGENLGKRPAELAQVIANEGISVWYSTPSILRMLVEFGKLEQFEFPRLRAVIFAGEVFPIKHLRALKCVWPSPDYFNFYGPTETNVCTYFKVPARIPESREEPFPIGTVCSGNIARIAAPDGTPAGIGETGELLISGDSVMHGYWNLPDKSDKAFLTEPDERRWYRTGDLVREGDGGELVYLSRRDRMVKRRGYRIELGEIEAVLYQHPDISEAAAVAITSVDYEVLVKAFVVWSGVSTPTTVTLKTFCSQKMPLYMVPDRFTILKELPKTSTDKVDYQQLKALA